MFSRLMNSRCVELVPDVHHRPDPACGGPGGGGIHPILLAPVWNNNPANASLLTDLWPKALRILDNKLQLNQKAVHDDQSFCERISHASATQSDCSALSVDTAAKYYVWTTMFFFNCKVEKLEGYKFVAHSNTKCFIASLRMDWADEVQDFSVNQLTTIENGIKPLITFR